ncbi:pyridoxal phosphate homeostasis protein-like protein [Tanacetum coccineum]
MAAAGAGSSAIESAAATALRSVLNRVKQAAERSSRSSNQIKVIAVSKTKPVSLLREVYNAGHRLFGENYVQEIIDKSPQAYFQTY